MAGIHEPVCHNDFQSRGSLCISFVKNCKRYFGFFLKFNISRETYYTASLIKIPGVGQRKPSVSVSLIWNKGKSG